MPYLVRIGRIDQNASGVGSRGYAVFRRGRKVIVNFGKVEAIGRGKTRFFWCKEPEDKVYAVCRTVAAATQYARELVREQLLPNAKGGYTRLPSGVRIHHPSRKPKQA